MPTSAARAPASATTSTCRCRANRATTRFSRRWSTALQRIRAFAPDALVVALGLDAFEGDPFGGLSVTTPGFARIAEAIAALGLPTVIVQEGGYLCDALGDNLTSFLTGYGGPHPERSDWYARCSRPSRLSRRSAV